MRLAGVNVRLVWLYVGPLDLCGCILGISWVGPLLHKKRQFWTETRLFSLEAQRIDDNTGHTRRPRLTSDQLFPSLARPDLALPRPQLAEIGPTLHPVVGKRRHVRESISFSSQTAPRTARQTPRTPPGPPQDGLKKLHFFFVQKKLGPERGRCNFLAVTRGRFAATGDGSPRLNDG